MARIAQSTIDRIKAEVSLLALVQSQGHAPKAQGKDYVMRCPFHDDRTPSLIITPEKNLWHCLGACNCGGSVIDWLMKTERLNFREAAEQLRQRLPAVAAANETPNVKLPAETKTAPDYLPPCEDDPAMVQAVLGHYTETLRHSTPGLAYLEKRGLNDPTLIEHFKLGYADQSLMRRIRLRGSKEGDAVRDHLQRLGLLRESGHEYFKGSIIVPILDETGQLQQIYGRKLAVQSQGNPQVHRYLPRPFEAVWHAEAVRGTKEIILCEALFDAMSFWVNGFRNVLSSYGVNGFTEAHLHLLLQHNIERVLIAYDADEAGNKAAHVLADQLKSHGIACFRLQFPKGMDANEYAVKVQPAPKSLGLVISKALYLGEGEAPRLTSLQDQMAVLDPLDLAVQREVAREAEVALPPLEKAAAKNKITPMVEAVPDTSFLAAALSDNANSERLETQERAEAAEKHEETAALNAPSITPDISASKPAEVIELGEKEIVIRYGQRRYRVRGLEKNQTYAQLKINLLVSDEDNSGAVFVDTFDVYSAKHRGFFIKQAALELGREESVLKKDLGQLLLTLETLQAQQIENTLKCQEKPYTLSPEEEKEALVFLKQPTLVQQLLEDFTVCGVVGEETNKLAGYLAAVSRKLKKPLAVVIQSSSAAGKSSLMDAVLAFVPEEERIHYSAMTGQSLFYMGQANLTHKILAIAEEEGAHQASYALKLLQSEGEISMASTGKNPATGQLETQTYKVEGPVMLFLTTTAIDLDEELLNRCLVLSVNEGREQTEAIHAIQREQQTLEGLLRSHSKTRVLKKHQNAQRLLRPLKIINPYATRLTFLADKTRTRRDHMKYLQLINAITLLHQYQREIQRVSHAGEVIEYIEASLADIALANQLAHVLLGRSLDELPPQTRRLLDVIYDAVQQACQQECLTQANYRFSRRDIRAWSGWSDGQLKIHCKRLEEMEYLLVHHGKRGQSIQYELLYSGPAGNAGYQLPGLIDAEALSAPASVFNAAVGEGVTPPGSRWEKSGVNGEKSAPSQGQVSLMSGGGQAAKNGKNTLTPALNHVSIGARTALDA